MTKHTPGRLRVNSAGNVVTESGVWPDLCGFPHNDTWKPSGLSNRDRLVACWNACEGMSDPEGDVASLYAAALAEDDPAPALVDRIRYERDALRTQRDELLALVNKFLFEYNEGSDPILDDLFAEARAAIRKVEEQG